MVILLMFPLVYGNKYLHFPILSTFIEVRMKEPQSSKLFIFRR